MKNGLLGILLLCAVVGGCGKTSPLSPTTPSPASPIVLTYAINIPNQLLVISLLAQFPDGRAIAPYDAQREYDYTSTYGRPNVYAGPIASADMATGYPGTGIVIAPLAAVASVIFPASFWPGLNDAAPETRYSWLGRFVYVPARR